MLDANRLVTWADTTYTRRGRYSHATDTLAQMQAAGYFSLGWVGLAKGTILDLVGSVDGTPEYATVVITASSQAGGVAIKLMETGPGAGITGSSQLMSARGVSSKASDAAVERFIAPFKGRIVNMQTVINAALATADATATLSIAGAAVTGGVATITQAGSAAGDVDTATPTAANTFNAGQEIRVTIGGGSTATATLNIQLLLEETA